MMNIVLRCNAGMGTGILQMKLEEEAKKRKSQANIMAMPMTEFDEVRPVSYTHLNTLLLLVTL